MCLKNYYNIKYIKIFIIFITLLAIIFNYISYIIIIIIINYIIYNCLERWAFLFLNQNFVSGTKRERAWDAVSSPEDTRVDREGAAATGVLESLNRRYEGRGTKIGKATDVLLFYAEKGGKRKDSRRRKREGPYIRGPMYFHSHATRIMRMGISLPVYRWTGFLASSLFPRPRN